MLISYPDADKRTIDTPVSTTQVAPTILKALGLNPVRLQAVKAEKTTLLPGLFRSDEDIHWDNPQ
jgi:arylsulfatase A-like enzyme